MGHVELLKVEHSILEKVVKRFNTSVKTLDEDVVRLQEWLETQPHLSTLLDAACLRNFLLLNKCSIENTKEKIDNYYTFRSKLTDIFSEMSPKHPYDNKFDKMAWLVVSAGLTDEMYRVCFFKLKNLDLIEFFEPIDLIKKLITIQELRLREDVMYGDLFIVDCQGITVPFILKLTPMMIYRGIVLIYEKIFSLRFKGAYFINLPPFGEKAVTIAKSFLKPKLLKRIHFCDSVESLKEVLPLKMLPKEFGGEYLSLDMLQEMLRAKRMQYLDLFDRLDEVRVDESLRPEKLKNDDLMGFHGNFKKLDID